MTAGTELTESGTLLYRQVPLIHLPGGKVSSAAFVPGPNHQSLLSTRHETVGAKRAYLEFIAANNSTEGSWAVTVGEVRTNGVCEDIAPYLDEFLNGAPEGHVSIDFNPSPSTSATKRIAKHLSRRAQARGRIHPPTVEESQEPEPAEA